MERLLIEVRPHLTKIGSLYLAICLQENVEDECINLDQFLDLVAKNGFQSPEILHQEALRQDDDTNTISLFLVRLDPNFPKAPSP